MIAEFRALRASVLRLWTQAQLPAEVGMLEEMTRFNEAIDEAIAESVARFTERMEHARNLLLAVMGHDLRNPLNAITLSAKGLQRLQNLDDRGAAAALQISRSAARMDAILRDLADLSRIRLGGTLTIERKSTDLAPACHAALQETNAAQPEAILRLDISGDLTGNFDVDHVARILSNLLMNAVQHGRGTEVTFTASGQSDCVILRVTNGGDVLTDAELRAIFAPTVRGAKAEARDASLGLGLYIAREIAHAHGGEIHATSSAEEGTTFHVVLPKL